MQLDGVLALLKHVADVNVKDNEGRTPWFRATDMAGVTSVPEVDLLLRPGADGTVIDQHGRITAEMAESSRITAERAESSRIRAKWRQEHAELVRTLLKDPPQIRRGDTAAIWLHADLSPKGCGWDTSHQTQAGTAHGIPGRAKVFVELPRGGRRSSVNER